MELMQTMNDTVRLAYGQLPFPLFQKLVSTSETAEFMSASAVKRVYAGNAVENASSIHIVARFQLKTKFKTGQELYSMAAYIMPSRVSADPETGLVGTCVDPKADVKRIFLSGNVLYSQKEASTATWNHDVQGALGGKGLQKFIDTLRLSGDVDESGVKKLFDTIGNRVPLPAASVDEIATYHRMKADQGARPS